MKEHAIDKRDSFKRGANAYQKLMESKTGKWKYAGEDHGLERLEEFTHNKMYDYKKKRDYPSIAGTSMLSPYLRTGAVSARTVYYTILDELGDQANGQGI